MPVETFTDANGVERIAGEISPPFAGAVADPTLAARGLVRESFPIAAASIGNGLAADRAVGSMIALYAGDVLTSIHAWILGPAVGAAPTAVRFGLWNSAGVLLKSTVDESGSGQWLAAGEIGYNLQGGAYTVPATGAYYAGLWLSGSWAGSNAGMAWGGQNNSPAGAGSVLSPFVMEDAAVVFPDPAVFIVEQFGLGLWVGFG